MASIRIHQDLYRFSKKRNLFTTKQWAAIAGAAAAGIGMAALNIYAFRLPPEVGVVLGIAVMAPFVVVGFVPLQGMPAEVYLEKRSELNERGDALVWKGEATPEIESEITNEHKKASKRRGFENRRSEAVLETAARIEAASEGLPEFSGHPMLP